VAEQFAGGETMPRWFLLFGVIFVMSGCGSTTPCNENDPVAACHVSHSRTYG